MKKVKRCIFVVLYVIFSYVYALRPELTLGSECPVTFSAFNIETFIMMLFVGAYITAFWIGINKLFRN